MDDATLIRRLGRLEAAEGDLARERAIEAVPARLRAMRSGGTSRLARLSPRLVAALAALCIALAAFTLLTPPGQAFTSWVGDRLGFGQPGEHPSLRQLRHKWTQGTSAEGQPAHVLVVGPGEEIFSLSGRASMAVSSIEASLNGAPVHVELVPIPTEFVQRFRLGQPLKFFVAFLEGKLRGGTLIVTARDSSGKVLSRRGLRAPDVVASQVWACEMAHRILREGLEKRRNALKNIRASCRGVDLNEP